MTRRQDRSLALALLIFMALIVLMAYETLGQSTTSISRKCPGASPSPARAKFEVERDGDINLTTCATKSAFFSNKIKLLDANFSPIFFNLTSTNYFSIGTTTRFSVPAANDFIGSAFNYPLTISGTSSFYTGQLSTLDLQGSPVSPEIAGSHTSIGTNSFFPTGTSTVYGTSASVDIGFPVTNGYGGYFSILSGGAGASGASTLTAVHGVVGMAHNGNTTNAFGGDFLLGSSSSSPSVVTTAAAVRARTTLNVGVTATSLRGLALTNWVQNGGSATNSYGIYADTSIDIGTTSKYFIYSLSTSPSRLSGDVYISDNSKGIILKSPDGTCYRYTAANGGALNAGVSVTCP